MPKILVVDHAPEMVNFLTELFKDEKDYYVELVRDRELALELINSNAVDIIITDYTPGEVMPLSILEHIKTRCPSLPCLVYAKEASYRGSVEAMRQGAFDYLTTSDDPDDIKTAIEKAFETNRHPLPRRRKEDRAPGYKFGDLVGESTEMKKVFRTIEKVSMADSTVLITGESGTGKELIARAIQLNSDRCDLPMVTINCGAIPRELLESELFGHEKGAFTGAHRTRLGRFEMANGGTIFLDEIGDMSPDLQVKLLRVLQEQNFERVGSTRSVQVDIRVLAATNKDLKATIEDGLFREDLYYRLNVIPIRVPPLRKRKTDIPLLINFFLKRMGGRRRGDLRRMKTFSDEAMEAMIAYDWPGNVRELENMMERLAVMIEGEVIEVVDLPQQIRGDDGARTAPAAADLVFETGLGFNDAVEQYQKSLISSALKETNGNKAKAAERLRMNRTTLVEKIKRLQIDG